MAGIYQVRNDQLGLPAADVVRLICLSLLDDAGRAIERLDAAGDAETLHDFRVALRRLRGHLKAYRRDVRSWGVKKLRRRLQKIASQTDTARETEVMLTWIESHPDLFIPEHNPGIKLFVENLVERQIRGYGSAGEAMVRDFPEADTELRAILGDESRYKQGPDADRYTERLGTVAREQVRDVSKKLSRVRWISDADRAHRARISAKRLRYLLEPLSSQMREVKERVRELQDLQDKLGDLHDLHVLENQIGFHLNAYRHDDSAWVEQLAEYTSGRVASPQKSNQDALLALAGRVKTEQQALYAPLQERWLGERAAPFIQRVEHLAERIAAIGS